MKKIFIFLFFLQFLFAEQNIDLIKGQALFLEFDKKDLQKITLNDKKINFFIHSNNKNKVVTIFSLPYKNPTKKNIIKAIYTNKEQIYTINSLEGAYKKEFIQVASNKVFPSKEKQKQIADEFKEASLIYANYTPNTLIKTKFQKPLDSFITSSFGKARIFNDKLASYHSGTDFRAKIGTKIKAANSGIVKLAKNRYYAGNSIIIDHGYGVYSQYYHLSKILVKTGDKIEKGQIIGLSGDSGRVNGPHLHFGIIVNQKQVDPIDFIQKYNALFGNEKI